MNPDKISVTRNGEPIGPYSRDKAKEYFAAGQLLPTDWGWHDGMDEWKPLNEVLGMEVPAQTAAVAAGKPGKGKKVAMIAGIVVLVCGLVAAGYFLLSPKSSLGFTITLVGVFMWIVSFVVMNSVFALSLWMYLPIEKSPFADSVPAGIKKCMIFSLVMGVIGFGLMFLGPLGALIMLVVFFIGMRRFFDCGILDTFILGAIQFGVLLSIGWILSKIG